MDKGLPARGQTLVELALVLPCFCLGIFMAVQLIYYCHNMVQLQRMATVALNHVSIENYKDAHKHHWFHSLYGRVTQPRDRFESQRPSPWRPFRGLSTTQEAGRIVRVTVKSRLLSGSGFSRVLARAAHEASAETLLEPPVPQEN